MAAPCWRRGGALILRRSASTVSAGGNREAPTAAAAATLTRLVQGPSAPLSSSSAVRDDDDYDAPAAALECGSATSTGQRRASSSSSSRDGSEGGGRHEEPQQPPPQQQERPRKQHCPREAGWNRHQQEKPLPLPLPPPEAPEYLAAVVKRGSGKAWAMRRAIEAGDIEVAVQKLREVDECHKLILENKRARNRLEVPAPHHLRHQYHHQQQHGRGHGQQHAQMVSNFVPLVTAAEVEDLVHLCLRTKDRQREQRWAAMRRGERPRPAWAGEEMGPMDAVVEILDLETIEVDAPTLRVMAQVLRPGAGSPRLWPLTARFLEVVTGPRFAAGGGCGGGSGKAKAKAKGGYMVPIEFVEGAIRQAAEAGRPEETSRYLELLVALSSSNGTQYRHQLSQAAKEELLGSVGTQHSPAWHMLKAYVSGNRFAEAVALLKAEGPERLRLDRPTLNMVLYFLAQAGEGPLALALLDWAEGTVGFPVDKGLYNLVLVALSKGWKQHAYDGSGATTTTDVTTTTTATTSGSSSDLTATARGLIERMRSRGVEPDALALCVLMDAHAEAGDAAGAMAVFFEELVGAARLRPNAVAFGTLMKAFARAGQWRAAVACLESMRELGLPVEGMAYGTVIHACGHAFRWEEALAYFEEAKRQAAAEGKVASRIVYTSAIHACARVGRKAEALAVLEEMKEARGMGPNAFAYNMAMRACLRADEPAAAVPLYDEMLSRGLRPDAYTVNSALPGLGLAGRFDDGLRLLAQTFPTSQAIRLASVGAFAIHALRASRGPEVAAGVMSVLQANGRNVTALLQAPLALALAGRPGKDGVGNEEALLRAMRLVLFAPSPAPPRAQQARAQAEAEAEAEAEAGSSDAAASGLGEDEEGDHHQQQQQQLAFAAAARQATPARPNWEDPWIVESRQWATAALMSTAAGGGGKEGEARWPLVLYLLDSLEARRAACVAGGRADYTEGAALDAAMQAVYRAAPQAFQLFASELYRRGQAAGRFPTPTVMGHHPEEEEGVAPLALELSVEDGGGGSRALSLAAAKAGALAAMEAAGGSGDDARDVVLVLPDPRRRAALRAFLAYEALPRGPWTGLVEGEADAGGAINGFDPSHVVHVPAAAVAAWKRAGTSGGVAVEGSAAPARAASVGPHTVRSSAGPVLSVLEGAAPNHRHHQQRAASAGGQ